MKIGFHRHFDKQFAKLSIKQKEQFQARLKLFAADRYNPKLNNHALQGKYSGYRSINVSGDLRAVFFEHTSDHIEFDYIGTHNKLYK